MHIIVHVQVLESGFFNMTVYFRKIYIILLNPYYGIVDYYQLMYLNLRLTDSRACPMGNLHVTQK